MWIRSLYRRNVGGLDRGIRLALGLPVIAAGLFLAGGASGKPVGIIIALMGLVALLTGITGRCPLYIPFGFSSARLQEDVKGSGACPTTEAVAR